MHILSDILRHKALTAILLLIPSMLMLSGCFRDSVPGSVFVEDFQMHFTFGEFGKSEKFSTPLSVMMTNTTEQCSYAFESDANGTVAVSEIMPGLYTVTVSGSLSAEEAAKEGKDSKGERLSLSGFLSNLSLGLDSAPSLEDTELFAVATEPVIFKELYYAGSTTPNNGSYRNDAFFSIYNNSSKVQDISDLYIGMNEFYGGLGESGPLWPGETVGDYRNVYLKSVWKIVAGSKKYEMQPGQTVVIATMAAPHNKEAAYNLNSPVDLSGADFEAYVVDPENKYPDFDAPNMEMAFWPDYGYLWRTSVFGQGMVLLRASREEFASFERVTLPEEFQDKFEDEEYFKCLKVPYSHVVDAVDLIQNGMVTNTKRFSPVLDAGYASVEKTYAGLSVIRKSIAGGKLKDTNNSTEDFEINDKPLSR